MVLIPYIVGFEKSIDFALNTIANATAVFHETIQPKRMNCEPLNGGRNPSTRKYLKKSKNHNKTSKKHNKQSNKHNKY